ncbi:hypothetical protein VKT23_013264 [Stygiomarasmius scandens]|uniref:F-box domain-containing protein n=1 Tax=Marasmiellus scandens TaxID=2682957 RepID=A0ABR1J8X0_9AGAR
MTLYLFNPELLTTNTVPDDDDIRRIRQICAEHLQNLHRMNTQIERLQASLDAITSKRDALQSKLSSLQSITSPLRTFPTEVLQSVFMNCLELFPVISAHEAPLLLTRICSRWRSVAIGTPALWTSFHVALIGAKHPFESYNSTCNAIRCGLQTFLLRSDPLPLNISLHSGRHSLGLYNEDIISEIDRTLEILIPHHKRWRCINLQFPARCMTSVEHLKGEKLLNLETAVIHCFGDDMLSQYTTMSPSPFFENAPRLRRLSIKARDRTVMFKLIGSASWAQLTHLIISFSYWESSPRPLQDLVSLLKACANLEECCIKHPAIDLEGFSTTDLLILPKLKKIAIDFLFSSRATIRLLDVLVLPELKELVLGGDVIRRNSHVSLISSIANFIKRSSCLMSQFGFTEGNRPSERTSPWDVEHTTSLLQLMPELNTLNLSYTHLMTEDLLEAFSAVSPDSEEILCPKLARIEFEDSPSITGQTLVHFLSTRLSPTSSSIEPLDCVVIKDARPSSDTFLSQFGDSVQFSTPWHAGSSHIDQDFNRPEKMF